MDLQFQGFSKAIGTGLLQTADGIALVDPGPTTCLGRLREGIEAAGYGLQDVIAVLLTHIHLDHATAAGSIVRTAPRASVYVHPVGAIHMVDPARLLASAGRIYGDLMDTLWGEFVPVPEERVVQVTEGDSVQIGDRTLEVAYTPGHAKHHVAYFEEASGTAWTGDVAGIRVPPGGAIPVTPPPDIDVELWCQSMDRVMEWGPERLVPTHFGPISRPQSHFAELRRGLLAWSEFVRESLNDTSVSDQENATRFKVWAEDGLRNRMPEEAVDIYTGAFGAGDSWWGLARYWRKKKATA